MKLAAFPRDAAAIASGSLLALLVILAIPWPVLRVSAGLALTLLLPGLALMSLLFPWAPAAISERAGARRTIDGLERLALAIGLSIAITPLLGLAIVFAGGHLGAEAVAVATGLVSILLSCGALLRARPAPRPSAPWRPARGDIVAILLAVLLAGAGAAYGFRSALAEPHFTQLALSAGDGSLLSGIPKITVPGNVTVRLVITNHEAEDTRYALSLSDEVGNVSDSPDLRAFGSTNATVSALGTIEVAKGRTFERVLEVRLDAQGLHRVVVRAEWSPPSGPVSRELHFWVEVGS